MKVDIDTLKTIYEHIGDEKSKDIFKNRLMYSISEDSKWIFEIIKTVHGGAEFIAQLNEYSKCGEIVIFGAGVWGRDLFQLTKEYPWKCFVDNNPRIDSFLGLPVIKGEEFLKNYYNEYIFISSRLYYHEIYTQLIKAGIPEYRMINVGGMLDSLAEEQYFDLECLDLTKEKEIFLDVGALDGMTSIHLRQRCVEDPFIYAFEPDRNNVEKCYENFVNYGVQHKIIAKGAWSEETTMHFQEKANGSSCVISESSMVVPMTTIDKELSGEKVTFIKMDIEGSELQALMGSENTIKKNAPKMAISVYHKLEDIWELPEIIIKYNPAYKLFFRHYSLTDYETVMYALAE